MEVHINHIQTTDGLSPILQLGKLFKGPCKAKNGLHTAPKYRAFLRLRRTMLFAVDTLIFASVAAVVPTLRWF